MLIVDAEIGGHSGPWVDNLYAGLSRLQKEVSQEVEAAIQGQSQVWGTPRARFVWRGWPRNLLRMPGLVLPVSRRQQHGQSPEPSPVTSSFSHTGAFPEAVEEPYEEQLPQNPRGSPSAPRLPREIAEADDDVEVQEYTAQVVPSPPAAIRRGSVPKMAARPQHGQEEKAVEALLPPTQLTESLVRGAADKRNSVVSSSGPMPNWSQVRPRTKCWTKAPTGSPSEVAMSTAALLQREKGNGRTRRSSGSARASGSPVSNCDEPHQGTPVRHAPVGLPARARPGEVPSSVSARSEKNSVAAGARAFADWAAEAVSDPDEVCSAASIGSFRSC